ncbi:MAG: amidohydrolase family protein [Candidatus Bathyarchaeota archaeon]|nr:amidohydrolase family protein [Candidatus Bathyarchaeota archaeon]
MSSFTLRGGLVLTPRGLIRADVAIEGGRISKVCEGVRVGETVDCSGLFIVPGFRDQHIHDLIGSLSDTSVDRLSKVATALVRHGVTSARIATIAMPRDKLLSYLRNIRSYVSSIRNSMEGARIEGAHIEGTFIRAECGGAQPREYIVEPWEEDAVETLDYILETKAAKLINIAVDFGSDLVEYASSKGLIVGCGHSKASAKQLQEAWRKGLKYIVHITNGAMGQSFKPFDGGGTYEGALTLPLSLEIIVDGYHVDMRYVSDIIERCIQKGRAGDVIAITDGVFPIEEEVPEGEFEAFSVIGCRSEDGGVLVVKRYMDRNGGWRYPPPGTLFGSLLTMDKAFENLLNLFTRDFSGFMIDRSARTFEEALSLASKITSTNQARLEGLDSVGMIADNRVADIAVLSIKGKAGVYRVKVAKTIVGGKLFEFDVS